MKKLESSIYGISGIGKVTAAKLEKLGINTLFDLIRYFPRAYEHRGNTALLSKTEIGSEMGHILTVATEIKTIKTPRGITISAFRAYDDSGSVEVVFYNNKYIKDVFHVGSKFRFYGKLTYNKSKLQLQNPKYEPYVDGISLAEYVPVYPTSAGLTSKQIGKFVQFALNIVLPEIIDHLPENIRTENELPTLSSAYKGIHCPDSEATISQSMKRFAFDEILCFGVSIALSESERKSYYGVRFKKTSLDPILSALPYELTPSQKNAINDIYRDTVIGKNGLITPMARILVGDVGCGKTVCALMSMFIAASSGYQSALMVPTEILARQHYKDAIELFEPLGIKTRLLLGSTKKSDKEKIYRSIEQGECHIVIGTHSLLSDKINFQSLGLIITDEQHRFGVKQRALLKEKTHSSHMLVMSATPIPRTLALTMYGDLDITRITDIPSGRQRVDTFVVDESYRRRIYDFIRKEIASGGQCYIVCPSIESESTEDEFIATDLNSFTNTKSLNLKSAVEYYNNLQKELSNISVGLLHGKMKATEKENVMARFAKGEIDVLVSTTVIEVGVNVPNASLMIVENAERFGLSQLHQLRGRVGRGSRKSYCILVSDTNTEKSKSRLEVMRTTYDGYEIAENDLILRGPGDFFSSGSDINLRQSGSLDFKFASLCDSTEIMEAAFKAARAIISEDNNLSMQKHADLRTLIMKSITLSTATLS